MIIEFAYRDAYLFLFRKKKIKMTGESFGIKHCLSFSISSHFPFPLIYFQLERSAPNFVFITVVLPVIPTHARLLERPYRDTSVQRK